ncbi:response regulator [Egicoccus sp. AB-alg2]|uniref:response regulator n=1 Tax=Egicoccus sp. AB-alg2 TaxID=3242693 RepID=UPI00359E4ADC
MAAVNEGGPDADERYRRAVAHAVLRGLVHDLSQPLATVTMAAAALRSATDDEERASLVDIVEREAMRAGALAADASARFAGPFGESPTVSVGHLVTALRERVVGVGGAGGVGGMGGVGGAGGAGGAGDAEVELEVLADLERLLQVDAALLTAALAALFADAATAPGRRRPVRVRVEVVDGDLTVTIADDGEPLPESVAARPFPAYLPDAPVARGVGLAVATARSIVAAHGGRIGVGAAEGGGTLVIVTIPGVVGPVAQPRAAADTPALPMTSRRALVVDDEEPTRTLLTMVLERSGWEVVSAADAADAEAAVAERSVDLVLLDLHLGTDSGTDVAARLEQRHPGVARRIVYLTGDPPRSGELDGCPALGKPFSLDELQGVIDRLTDGG